MNSRMDRRGFLKGSAIAAASVMSPSTLANGLAVPANGGGGTIQLGVASYSFRKFDRAHVIDFMKQLKTPFLSVKDFHLPVGTPDEIKKGSAEFAAGGVQLVSAGVIYFPLDEDADMRRKFEYCKLAGVPRIIAGPTKQTLPRLERFAKEYDLKIAIHNHGPEDKEFPSPLDALNAVKDMDPRMGLCIDVGHTARAGTDIVEAIHKAGARLYDVHIKDLTNPRDRESYVDVGDGILPIPKIFEALIAVDYKGYVDLEHEIQADNPMPGMIKSFAYMRGVLAGMGVKA